MELQSRSRFLKVHLWGGGFTLLPARPGTCPECAVDHDPKQPHNQQSLYYQYHFYAEHQRWPTWDDAMAHCDDQIKTLWISELRKAGVPYYNMTKGGKLKC